MNFFKKALIAILSVGLVTVPATREVETVEAAGTNTLYFKPGVWNVDGAIFRAWTWGGAEADSWVNLTDTDSDGIYEGEIFSDRTDIIFLRAKSGSTGWNNEWNRVQTTYKDNLFSIDGWSYGSWSTYTPPVKITSTFYYYNSLEWDNVYCHAWSDNSTVEPSAGWPGTLMTDAGREKWLKVTYTYYDSINILFNNGEGTQTADIKGLTSDKYFYGKEIDGYDSFDDVEHASAAKFEVGSNIYFAPNNNWRSDNARFAAYFYGASNTWINLVDTDSNGVYETTVPEGEWTHVIFCRMNPSFEENRWNNENEDPKPVWNKTGDIAVSEGNNYYSLDEGSWDTGKWLKYEDYNFMTHGDTILLRAVPWIKNRETNSVAVRLWSNSDKTWLPMTYIENTNYFEITVPDAGVYNEFKFAQMSGSDESKFGSEYVLNNNYTNDIKYDSTYNVYEIPDNYEGDEATTCTFKNTKVGTGYYVPTDVKAELGFTYSYNDSTGEITGVENMKMRLSSDYISLDSFVNINVNDITGYGMRIAKGNDISVGVKTQLWTNSQIGKFTYNEETKTYEVSENPTYIRWALTIENIPSEYYTGEFTYECFIVINEEEYTISNTRTVSVKELASTYANMEGIREDHKEACQFIVDGKYAVAA